MRNNPNHMHWVIKIIGNGSSLEVLSSYFDGTAAQCKKHIKEEYLTDGVKSASGAQRYYPLSLYSIYARPNGLCFEE